MHKPSHILSKIVNSFGGQPNSTLVFTLGIGGIDAFPDAKTSANEFIINLDQYKVQLTPWVKFIAGDDIPESTSR